VRLKCSNELKSVWIGNLIQVFLKTLSKKNRSYALQTFLHDVCSLYVSMTARDSIHGFMTKTCQTGLWLNQTQLYSINSRLDTL